jgi:2Fe-2S ferredoxin
MTKITFVEHDGTTHVVDVEDGISLMEAAVENNVPGIDGDCGGEAACATCHIYVDGEWSDQLSNVEEQERAMLEFCESADSRSRLGCQIGVRAELDGLVVQTPVTQY